MPPAAPVTPLRATGWLEFDGVDVPLPGRGRARCCATSSFTARPGQTTAIIGSTGAGKTTLLSLVPRLFDATGGAVLVDGVDVRELEPEELWGGSGSCRSGPTCSPARSRRNLRYGNPDATDEELWARAGGRAGRGLRAGHAGGPRGADRPGRHERLRRPAPAARDRPGAGAPARDLPVRRLVLRARPRHRRPAARRAAAGHRRGDRGDRRPARVDHRGRRPDRRARRRRRSSARARTTSCWRTARRTPRSSSPSTAARGGGRHERRRPTSARRRDRDAGEPASRRRDTAARRAGHGGAAPRAAGRRGRRGACRPRRRWTSARPRGGCWVACGPSGSAWSLVLVLGVISVALNVIGPMILGRATDVIFAGVIGKQLPAGITGEQAAEQARAAGNDDGRGRDREPARRARRRASTSPRSATVLLVVDRDLRRRLAVRLRCRATCSTASCSARSSALRRDVEDKLNRLPLRYFDARAARRGAQPGHQRHRQRLAEPAADDEPAAHVAAHGGRRARDDGRGLAAARGDRAGDHPAVAVAHPGDRASASQKQFVAQWRHTGALNGQIEEAFTGHELVKVFGRRHEVEAAFRGEERGAASTRASGAQFVSGIIMPSMMFIGNLNYVAVAVVGGLRVASGAMSLGDVQAFIQYSRQFTQPLTQVGVDGEPAAVRRRLGRAGVRAARRARAGARPGPTRRARASGAAGWRSSTSRSRYRAGRSR